MAEEQPESSALDPEVEGFGEKRDLKEMSPMPDPSEIPEVQEEPKPKKLDWEALIAAAEEDFDLLESPVDAAAKALKTMPETIATCGEEAISRLLPLIQDMISLADSLDIHCDTSDLYKALIKDTKYESQSPGLKDKLVTYILENVERVRDNVAAAAWLETLLDIIDCISVDAVTELIVPLAISQAAPTKRIQRRVISARLLEKLCAIIPAEFIRKDLAPCAKMLCQDPNATVRTAIAQRLSVIAQSLNNSTDCVSLLLPCLIELCKDDDPGVREAILNTIAVCLPYFTKESRKTVVIPLLRKCTEQALILRDISLSVVAKQLGPWLFALKEILSPQEQRWFLDTFCRIVNLAAPESDKSIQNLALNCRRMCAYNFPCFAMIYGGDSFNDKLLPILEKFTADSDEEVRCTVAAGFHEIVLLKPDEPALLNVFIELVKSGAVEVVQHLVKNLNKMLPIFYAIARKEQEKKPPKVTKVLLDRMIVSCNRLVRNTGNWRAHEAYLINLASLKSLVTPNDLLLTFVPVLKQEVLTARALPCRIAAAVTMLHFMREFPLARNRHVIIDFFTKIVAKHESCHRRRILLDIVPMLLQHFSRSFFKQHFLEAVLKLNDDPVSNIRLQLCRMMPRIKMSLLFPEDEKALLSLEKSVRNLLTSESSSQNDRQLLQLYACELSRAETLDNPKSDSVKLSEEQKLWTEIDAVSSQETVPAIIEEPESPHAQKSSLRKGVVHKKKVGNLVVAEGTPNTQLSIAQEKSNGISLLKPPMVNGYFSSSSESDSKPPAWKTNRIESKARIAVVRPQPQIIITQRSPSPMPPRPEETKGSKLPLSSNPVPVSPIEQLQLPDRLVSSFGVPLPSFQVGFLDLLSALIPLEPALLDQLQGSELLSLGLLPDVQVDELKLLKPLQLLFWTDDVALYECPPSAIRPDESSKFECH
ncbi:hypothetical protein FO519_009061 [Halicephalobus sp. NKZ332]|nr:hypothetical protein FO519_009061 [Halicephalobus sp. NKZ332]